MDTNSDDSPLFCDRCSRELHPGRGDFYVVRIEALADPTPPEFSWEDLHRDHRREIENLVEQISHLSERELMDQVVRHLTIFLCVSCYTRWIENPAG
jgi:hypothetical protein